MRVISTKTHGLLDYISAVLLVVSPWIFGFSGGGAAQYTAILAGVAIVIYSSLTDYEASIVEVLPVPLHLGLDLVLGLFLATSPWVFGFSATVYAPHLILGIFTGVVAAFSRTRSARVQEFMLTYREYIA